MLNSGFGFLNTNMNYKKPIKVSMSQNLGIIRAQNEVGSNPADIAFQQTQNIEVPGQDAKPGDQNPPEKSADEVEQFKAFVIDNYERPEGVDDVNIETIYAFAINGQYFFDLENYSDGLIKLQKSLSTPSVNLPVMNAEALETINSLINILNQNRTLVEGMRNFITGQDTTTVPDTILSSMQSGSNQ
jgi:hypothetical protein